MRRAPLLAFVGATLLVGCGPADVSCDAASGRSETARLTQNTMGTSVLSAQASQEKRFEIVIEQISSVGFASIDEDQSYVYFRMALGYDASQPPGAQLPPVVHDVFFVRDGKRVTTDSPYPTSILSLGFCDGSNEASCCPAEEATCRMEVGVEFSRDDVIFPDIQLTWSAEVQLTIHQCDDEPQFALTLREIEP